ncbi:MAG: biotin/acetyl-CoA-carboxylase ligase [Burkholderiaceae bacterium]|nr:biotin/acetyl-CoA-carboxylase ligase [Burkholderiaceae bacterium]
MSEAPFSSNFLSASLPDKPAASGCFALTEGLGGEAVSFSLEALFGVEALLGPTMPQSDEAAADFFNVPAPVYLCDEVTSTFAVAHALAQKGALPTWGAVLAACQTAGKGQLRRQWQSPRGNLYVTFRLPDNPLFQTSAPALVTGVLLAMALGRLGYPLRLKWPNDLLNRDQAKAAGILLENRGGVLLAGVGVNLRALPDVQQLRRERAAPAGLLLTQYGEPAPLAPFALWQALVREAISTYDQTFANATAEALPDLVEPFLTWRGESVTVSDTDGTLLSGMLEGISPAGGLCLRTSDGRSHELFRGSLARA